MRKSAVLLVVPSLVAAVFTMHACKTRSNKSGVASDSAADPDTIRLIGLNDLHGNIRTKIHTIDTGNARIKTPIGGIEALGAYFKIAHENNPNTLVLDAGDIYQGTFISNYFQGLSLVDAYAKLGIRATTFGNHEFDWGVGEVSPGVKNPDVSDPQRALTNIVNAATAAGISYLSANVTRIDGSPFNPNMKKSRIFEVGGFKIGVVGATTTAAPTQTSGDVSSFKFNKFIDTVPAEAERLRREEGAQLVVLITHAGGDCRMTVDASDGDNACKDFSPSNGPVADEVTEMLRGLPLAGADGKPNLLATVDVVLAGHRHRPEAHFITNRDPATGTPHLGTLLTVPVLQTTGFGKSFSMVDIKLNRNADPKAPVSERVASVNIHPQTYLCYQHFSQFPNCSPELDTIFGSKYPADIGSPIQPTFLGKTVALSVDPTKNTTDLLPLTEVLLPYKKKIDATYGDIDRVIVDLPKSLPHDRTKESKMANCFVDSVLEQYRVDYPEDPVDLMIINSSSVRDQLDDGKITFEMLFALEPFGAKVTRMDLTRQELEALGVSFSVNIPSAIAVVSEGWKVRIAGKDSALKPPHQGFIPPERIKNKQRFAVITNDFSAGVGPKSPHVNVLYTVNAEGRIKPTEEKILTLLERHLKNAPLPESCKGATPDRTVAVQQP